MQRIPLTGGVMHGHVMIESTEVLVPPTTFDISSVVSSARASLRRVSFRTGTPVGEGNERRNVRRAPYRPLPRLVHYVAMPHRRTLSLKREVLQELTATDLHAVVGGQPTGDQTNVSCLDYISCWAWQCLPRTLICPQ